MQQEYKKYILLLIGIIIVFFFFLFSSKDLIAPQENNKDNSFCAQIITYAMNPQTNKCEQFSTPCDVPENYIPCSQDPYYGDTNIDKILLYYPKGDRGSNCGAVESLQKEIPRRYETIEVDTLVSLLEKISEKNKLEGYYSDIPPNTRLKSLTISNGMATANFSKELNLIDDSCVAKTIIAQIEKTLLQFPEINSVIIEIEDK